MTPPAEHLQIAMSQGKCALVSRHGKAINATEVRFDQPLEEGLRAALVDAPAARSATITLLRPLAHAASIDLPRMSSANAARVIARDAPRHVIGDGTPMSVRATWIGAQHAGYATAFVAEALLQLLEDLAAEHGWTALEVRTADDVIAGAAQSTGQLQEGFGVVCDQRGPTHIVEMSRGIPILGRTLPADASVVDLREFIALAGAGDAARAVRPLVIFGNSARGAALAAELGRDGHRTIVADAGLPATASADAIIAALGARSRATLPLRSRSSEARMSDRYRLLTLALAAACLLAVVAGFALYRAGIHHALAAIDQQRAEISAPVANALARRTAVQRQVDLAAALAGREKVVPVLTELLTALSTTLPPDASITTLAIKGDTVTIEGESGRSTEVYDVLRNMPLLRDLAQTAALRRERTAGDEMIEHFAYSAHLRTPLPGRTP